MCAILLLSVLNDEITFGCPFVRLRFDFQLIIRIFKITFFSIHSISVVDIIIKNTIVFKYITRFAIE